ncbi:hypothetical protein HPULCUR_003398 [Helicostylum pulchrum]|uniref:Uncharacterized protein n=1 Tax=Helicostylum pulchrum TaxID=562976 RepID=A0ABP9XTA1_9FUNG
MFALLAMLKTIADRYHRGTVGTFQKLKLYFIQPSDKCIRLWSMGYHQNGVYYLIREANIKISEHFQSKNKTLTELSVFNDIGVLGRYSGCVKDTQRRA